MTNQADGREAAAPPLTGLRMIELASGPRSAFCAKLLADMGAEVIAVEPPGGSAARRIGPFAGDVPDLNRSLRFWYDNTSKRGVTLNLQHAEGRALFERLLAAADVLIEAEAPGALDALGCGYAALAERFPRLVWAAITPFGQAGPYKDFAMTDLTSMALGGPMASCGYDDLPGAPPIRPTDLHSLHMAGEYAAMGIMIALLERRQSGRGQYLDVSIHEACACTTEGSFPNWEYFRRVVLRQTGRHAAATVTPRWQYRCADGRDINMIGGGIPRNARAWRPLLAWMDEHGLAEDLHDPQYERIIAENPYHRGPVAAHLAAVIGRFVQALPAEEVYRRGQALHMPWGPVRSPDENLDDPHWRDRGFFVEVEHPELGRTITYPGLPYRLEGSPGRIASRAPLLGEHTYQVYVQELGLSPEALRGLFEQGAV
ncbi:MAG TPA: CoA transferase [Dehalococcoidia bacterium]|nr:CoA transferase [Dehalococcoidia bacterium]